ncbi:MAG: PEP-CTERM sorting domain-containing protein, partial [Verrucomicrobiota bacterium]
RQVRNLEEDAYYAWEVINASGGIAIDGIEQDGDFIPAEFLGIGAFSGDFAFWQGDTDYLVEYIPVGQESRYDPAVNSNPNYSYGVTIRDVSFGVMFNSVSISTTIGIAGTLQVVDGTANLGGHLNVIQRLDLPSTELDYLPFDYGDPGAFLLVNGELEETDIVILDEEASLVPEPTTGSLLALVGLLALSRRRQRAQA